MKSISDMKRIAADALQFCKAQKNVIDAEIFVATNGTQVGRFNFTSSIKSNGLEEPKGTKSQGIGVFIVFKDKKGIKIGFGSEEGSIDEKGVKKAFKKAYKNRYLDPEFVSLPKRSKKARTLFDYHDPAIMDLEPESFTAACWRILDGAVETARGSKKLAALMGGEKFLRDAGLIVSGDITLLQEQIAICSTAMPEVQTDQSTLAMAFVTCMVEKFGSKGSGYGSWTRLADIDEGPGARAMENAIMSLESKRVPSGNYTVIFGAAAMAELIGLALNSLSLDGLYSYSSMFNGKLGERVAEKHVQLFDDAAAKGLVASKGITCEGLPTGKTMLLKDGVFVGTIANWYESQRMLRDPDREKKLGKNVRAYPDALAARNGFRFSSRDGGRHPSATPSPFGTNVILSSSKAVPLHDLISHVDKGLLIGRMWYVYPMGPASKGDFTGTVIADSYRIENGRIVGGITVNSLRINDNLLRILQNIQGMSEEHDTPLVWAADSVRHMPKGTLVTDVSLEAIAEN